MNFFQWVFLKKKLRYREKGYRLLKVPPIYREAFEDNLDLALTDNAGISTSSSTKYISGIRLNQAKDERLPNPLLKMLLKLVTTRMIVYNMQTFFRFSRINPTDMSRPFFIHP